ncbi:MAG: hypothetical protein AB7E47_15955 [Desulfovibrionaceae bacterium]
MEAPPCVGCGWCCLSDQCEESHRLHGFMRRCPEVYWSEENGCYRCRLAAHPEKGAHYRATLFMGEGCCARFNTWRTDVRNRDAEL